METKRRIGWIDICKSLAIFLMVLGHIGVSEVEDILIHSFHMPVFFVLSGYSLDEKKFSVEMVRKKFCTLIVPYIVFGISLFLLWDCALLILNRSEEVRSVSNLFYSLLWHNANASAFGVIQWFLPCLFFSEVFFMLIYKISKTRSYVVVILAILSIVAWMYPKFFEYRLPWALDCALMATVFVGWGWLLRSADICKLECLVDKNRIKSGVVVGILVLLGLPLVFINGMVNMRTTTYGNLFIYLFNALYYSGVLILFSMLLDRVVKGRFIKWIGRNTLMVLLLNSTFIRIWNVLAEMFFGKVAYPSYINWAVAFIVVIGCVIVSELVKRFCPIVLGKRNNDKFKNKT